MANKFLSYVERIKAVTDLAVENKLPVEKVLKIYDKFNRGIYEEYNDNSGYNSALEEKAFQSL